jgi:hypothetical protein
MYCLLTKKKSGGTTTGQRWRRKGWSIADRRLLAVTGSQGFTSPVDFCILLPPGLPKPFSTQDLAQALNLPRQLAQKMVFCLRTMGTLQTNGKLWPGLALSTYGDCSNSPAANGS